MGLLIGLLVGWISIILFATLHAVHKDRQAIQKAKGYQKLLEMYEGQTARKRAQESRDGPGGI